MKHHLALLVFSANLAVLALLAVIYPHLMIAPGTLIEAHAELTRDCFACHDAWLGTPSERCLNCHKIKDIGVLTSKGVVLRPKPGKGAFHHKLVSHDCLACHSDHAGVLKFRRATGRFSHGLLDANTRGQCASCHAKPDDSLHRQVGGECSQCHSAERWKPASFDHQKYFELDRDHNARCVVCHVDNNYRRYTCYGCHEHTPDNIWAEHAEEGVRNLDNCVRCHRNSREIEGED
jgi:hypothetical protein